MNSFRHKVNKVFRSHRPSAWASSLVNFLLSLAIFVAGLAGGYWFRGSALANSGALACGDGSAQQSLAELAWQDLSAAPAFGLLHPAFVHGERDASVNVQLLVDYECPFSQRYLQQILPRLLDQGEVYVEVLDFPLVDIHPNATLAAQGARCAADQNRYMAFLLRLFEEESVGEVYAAASRAGLDGLNFEACLTKQQAVVSDSFEQLSKAGYESTPTTIINGKMVSGAIDWSLIERWLAEAK